MDTWYSVDLGDGVAAYQPSSEMQQKFFLILATAGAPHDMALFSKYDLKKNIVTVYFTPSSQKMANSYNATPCDKPSYDDLSLLVGDARVWDIFYPERKK